MTLKTSLLLTLQKHCWGTRGRAAKGTLVFRKEGGMMVHYLNNGSLHPICQRCFILGKCEHNDALSLATREIVSCPAIFGNLGFIFGDPFKEVNMKVEDALIQLEEIILEHRKQFRRDVLKVVNDIELQDSIAFSNEDINDIADALIMVAHLKAVGAIGRKQCITCRFPRKSFEEELQEVFEKNKYTHVGYSDKAMCE